MAIACCSSPSTMYLREVYAVHEFCKSSSQKKSVFLREEGSASGGELLALGFVNVGEREIEFVQGVENDAGNDEAREPFVVRGNYVPGSVFGGGLLDHFLVRSEEHTSELQS